MDQMFESDLVQAKKLLDLQPGDNIVMTGGQLTGSAGNTNLIKVEQVI